MIKNKEQLQAFYNTLDAEYEGYIQLSDRRIEDVFKQKQKLPAWDEIHNGINYILEMALFEPIKKRSILFRQHNNQWLVLDEVIDESMPTESFFTVMKEPEKMIMAQVWVDVENEFCNGWKVKEIKKLLFAGFENGGRTND